MSQIYDRRIMRTKKLLRESFTRLLQEKPLEKITVKELCDLAGINRSTFYLHYQDLRDMHEQIEEDLYRTFEEKLDRLIKEDDRWYGYLIEEGDLPTAGIFLETFYFIQENKDVAAMALSGSAERNIVMRIYKKGKESFLQEFADKVSPEELSKLSYFYEYVASGCVGVITGWVQSGMKQSPEEMNALTQELVMQTPLPSLESSPA